MSAIYGAIDLQGNPIPDEVKKILREAYDECKIDRYEERTEKNVFMGCGIQYFTPEAEWEKLPFMDAQGAFTADVMLDNRSELCQKLGIEETSELADGAILQRFYGTYREKALNELLGAYCFVDYDYSSKMITVVSDAVGYRFVYYLFQNGIFYFSSLMEPLVQLIQELRPNTRWIADYIGQDNLNMFTEAEETIYLGIKRIAPGTILSIKNGIISQHRYWDPYKNSRKIRFRKEEDYKDEFLKLYKECVNCLLRANGEVAMMLSGGYDSSSVAALAAPILQKQGKKLYAYTSVPFEGYQSDMEDYLVDESELVKCIQKRYPNIVTDFMHMPDMSPWDDRKWYRKVAEMPYKSPQNMLWMYESMERARKENARIILVGAFGNGTVSFDNTEIYMDWLLKHFHWRKLWQELEGFHRRWNGSRKRMMKSVLKFAIFPPKETIRKEQMFCDAFCREDFLRDNGADSRLEKIYRKQMKGMNHYTKYRSFFMSIDVLRHYGEFSQKNSLYTGVILRDPTRDKRMMEFTLGIPYDQFTHDGITRRLIKEYMNDLIPAEIFKNRKQGRQSADLKARICREKERIKEEWLSELSKWEENKVIDINKLRTFVAGHELDDLKDFELVRIIYTISLLEFMEEKQILQFC